MPEDVDSDLQRVKLEEDARERKREMWMWFVGLMVCVAALTVATVIMFDWFEHRNREENVTKRVKLETCKSIETETARVVCVNGWGQ